MDGYSSCIRPPAMKQRIHRQPLPCKQRPAGSIGSWELTPRCYYDIYLPIREGHALLLSPGTDFDRNWFTLSDTRGARANPIGGGCVVVVRVAVVVDVVEVGGRASRGRAQPPVRGTTNLQHIARITYRFGLYRSRSALSTPFTNLISVLIIPLHSFITDGSKWTSSWATSICPTKL